MAEMFLPAEDPRGDLIVIGGGCYGSYHARQLQKARLRKVIDAREIVIVDRDSSCRAFAEFAGLPGFRFVTASWNDFHDLYFDRRSPATRDHIVPTPIAPHLMYDWLLRRASGKRGKVEPVPMSSLPDTPAAFLSDKGAGLLSFATWICPVTCIEPAVCPKTRGPKAWEMDEAVFAYARRMAVEGTPYDAVEVFRCRHYAWGVATFPSSRGVLAGRRIDRLVHTCGIGERRVLVATVSSCHGIANTFRVTPRHQ
jgi:hypothetical protein